FQRFRPPRLETRVRLEGAGVRPFGQAAGAVGGVDDDEHPRSASCRRCRETHGTPGISETKMKSPASTWPRGLSTLPLAPPPPPAHPPPAAPPARPGAPPAGPPGTSRPAAGRGPPKGR